MNTTEYFKRTIQAYLEERAMEDELFAAKYDNPDKNIDDCVTYILNWVQKSGCNGFCDDEIYGQAIHYYEEKDIEVGKPLNCQVCLLLLCEFDVVVNRHLAVQWFSYLDVLLLVVVDGLPIYLRHLYP